MDENVKQALAQQQGAIESLANAIEHMSKAGTVLGTDMQVAAVRTRLAQAATALAALNAEKDG